ncbi:hypothetical protein LC087_17650 [Bacillus carboniphilus]|uniref:YtzI protein n=1 Tax=Bacillus carboniphilus TaxID=86663 RepID=A0ABY9JVK4_9BACI|nr:hypothetical protein [Bacillus carboniphilus]WLR42497.1 hypothetical protein LC087_17650 [Bacillus carboniphilus]
MIGWWLTTIFSMLVLVGCVYSIIYVLKISMDVNDARSIDPLPKEASTDDNE